ncbi:NifB/NifX family molybdenum-iron cluster-binding protein [Clostridium felsineum]|uniref:NifB/NifX family molybdenum-iron cluster-binding protein n=1 Tax=Clostridium felsineum TaxID=36839 RepID=UPI00098C7B25|nr:NifB/NifX family molybdenum-iron cluster-binding protein [Clostridium felsineum]URZ03426.1 hypothetical protein CLAUR_034850 [Clostridium felsineum]
MKIAVPNDQNMVNQHFGKSKSFIIATVEDNKIVNTEEVSTVELAHQHQGLAKLLLKNEVDLVIVGGIGAGALTGLSQNGLKVIRGASGEYTKAIEKYISGDLQDKNVICNHHGEHNHTH